MTCIYCSTSLPEKAKFCSNCTKQVKCKVCNEALEKNAAVCIECGEVPGNLTRSSENVNTIEYSETRGTRLFKASFTDEVGHNMGNAFVAFMGGKIESKKAISNVVNNTLRESQNITEDTDYLEVQPNNELDMMRKIFNDSGSKISLSETRLKAKSKRDAGIRLAIIFLYYKYHAGHIEVPRKELTSIMQDASLEDGNWRHWLVNNNLVGIKDDLVELKAPGREEAKKYVTEILDSAIEDQWKLGSSKPIKRGKKKEVIEIVEDGQ